MTPPKEPLTYDRAVPFTIFNAEGELSSEISNIFSEDADWLRDNAKVSAETLRDGSMAWYADVGLKEDDNTTPREHIALVESTSCPFEFFAKFRKGAQELKESKK